MTGGRTTWWPKDAAWHRRELIVELGEELGPEGPHLVDVLCAWAQEQMATGQVKGGFRALSRESFITQERCREIIEFAAAIGVVDELEVAEDGRRFTCRISGWRADQERGRAAWRQAAKRLRDADEDSETSVTDRDVSRPVTPSPSPSDGLKAVRFGGRIVPAKVVTVAEATLADFNERAGTAYKPYTGAGKPTEAFKRIIGAFVERDITLDQAVRINALGLQGRFWEGPAQPGHVWSPGVIERNIEATRGASASNGGSGERERFLEAQKRALGDPENVA